MGMIQTLSDEVINCLAAGEVVEKPASVLKELVENSIDAGATEIEVQILAGGTQMICVTDNGHGMSPEDAVHCFGRHATSKLRDFDEMVQLVSLGFRGEALAAIASVSQIRLCTRQASSEMGTEILLEGGDIKSVKEIGTPIGTRFEVKNLFYNTPARRKFLRKETTEGKWLEESLKALALSAPQTEMRFVSQGKPKWQILSDGDWCEKEEGPDPERVIACLGERVREELLPFVSHTDNLKVYGFLVTPSVTRRDNKGIRLMVNGRWVSDRDLMQTIKAAYRPYLEPGRSPMCVLHLQIDPQILDFNAHPQKTEIRIVNRREIQSSLIRLITIFLVTQKPQNLLELKRAPIPYALKPSGTSEQDSGTTTSARDWFPQPQVPSEEFHRDLKTVVNQAQIHHASDYVLENVFLGRYGLLRLDDDWWLFELQKYAAQVQKEKLLAALGKGSLKKQRLLFPSQVAGERVPPCDSDMLEKELEVYGFEATLFDENKWMLKSIPCDAGNMNPETLFLLLAKTWVETSDVSITNRHEAMVRVLCEKDAPISHENAQHLVDNLKYVTQSSFEKFMRPLNDAAFKSIFRGM